MRVRYVTLFSTIVALTFLVMASPGAAQHSGHVMFTPDGLQWTDTPALPGAKVAVIEGPLTEAVPFTFRLKFPANYKIAPHWHPAVERVTVLSGTIHLGVGDTFDQTKAKALPAGSISIMEPKMHHFAWTSEETVVQLSGMGPWGITFVNPADDPRKKKGVATTCLPQMTWERSASGLRSLAAVCLYAGSRDGQARAGRASSWKKPHSRWVATRRGLHKPVSS